MIWEPTLNVFMWVILLCRSLVIDPHVTSSSFRNRGIPFWREGVLSRYFLFPAHFIYSWGSTNQMINSLSSSATLSLVKWWKRRQRWVKVSYSLFLMSLALGRRRHKGSLWTDSSGNDILANEGSKSLLFVFPKVRTPSEQVAYFEGESMEYKWRRTRGTRRFGFRFYTVEFFAFFEL